MAGNYGFCGKNGKNCGYARIKKSFISTVVVIELTFLSRRWTTYNRTVENRYIVVGAVVVNVIDGFQ